MPKIEVLYNLLTKLDHMKIDAIKESDKVTVQVGYTQRYAIWVHEDMEAHHTVGQAKYLEAPARTNKPKLIQLARKVYKKTKSLRKALIFAGLRLQRESQKLVPVDTSALKASAYTASEEMSKDAAASAFGKSEKIRVSRRRRYPKTGRFIK